MERKVKIVGYGQEIELVLIDEYDFEVKYTHPSTGQECQEIEKIKVNGKKIHLGYYGTIEEAKNAYLDAKRMMHDGCTI